jgi:hypothetical protein
VQLEPAIPLGARTVGPLRLHGFAPVLVVANGADAAMLFTVNPTAFGLDIVAVPTVALVEPTCSLPNARPEGVIVIVPATPVPLRFTVCVPLVLLLGTFAVPLKVPRAVAVKSTPNVQWSPAIPLGCSVAPEHPSDTIVQFGPALGPEVVVAVIVPIVIGVPDWFSAVSILGPVVVAVFPYTELVEIIEYGVTCSDVYTFTTTVFDVLVT